MTTPVTKTKTEIVELKYSFNVSKIIPRELLVREIGSSILTQVYDISLFSSVKYQMSQIDRAIGKEFRGYQHKIYAYRATKKSEGTEIGKLKFVYKFDHLKKFVHVNVEMIPTAPKEGEPLLTPQPLLRNRAIHPDEEDIDTHYILSKNTDA